MEGTCYPLSERLSSASHKMLLVDVINYIFQERNTEKSSYLYPHAQSLMRYDTDYFLEYVLSFFFLFCFCFFLFLNLILTLYRSIALIFEDETHKKSKNLLSHIITCLLSISFDTHLDHSQSLSYHFFTLKLLQFYYYLQ